MQARETAYRILADVENGAYANIILDEYLRTQQLSVADRGLVTEIVYGTVKYRLKLDWIIGQLVKKSAKLETGPRIILRLSLYQILFLERVPPSAVTNEAVKLAKKLFHAGVAGLINGVLRNYLRNPDQVIWPDSKKQPIEYLEVCFSHPRWMVARWLVRYGFAQTQKLCEFNNRPADLWIRTNTLRCSREDLFKRLTDEGCIVEKSRRIPTGLLLLSAPPLSRLLPFAEGLFTVQDESSMLVAHVVWPAPGQEILDVCAGPGGKSTHLAQLMENKGLIVACDVHEHRLRLIEDNARRLGVTIIKTVLADATKMAADHEAKYDLILVDAPCSGLGVLRRRADSRWRKQEGDIHALAGLQKQIIENAISLLKVGGRLVYSTCTIEPEENEENIARIIREHPELRAVNLISYMPYEVETDEEKLELGRGVRQYLPFADNMEGFFIAALEKTD